ncbi:MAG: efflux RND transporter permease subunit [Myxococcota bacterium]
MPGATGESAAGDPLALAFALGCALLWAGAVGWALARPRQVVEHPWSVAVAVGITVALAAAALFDPASGALRLRFDASTEPLLPSGDPARAFYDQAVRTFGDDEVFVIALECEDVFTVRCLSTLGRVSDRIAHLEGVRSVRSLLDVTSFRWVAEEQWVEVRPFIEEIPEDPAALRALRDRALADPIYRRTWVAEDGRAAAINVRFRDMGDDEFIASGLDSRIASILAGEASEDLALYVSGRPHIKARVYAGMVSDLRALIPLGIAVAALVIGLATGRRRGVVLPLGVALVANLWTFAAMAFLGHALTILTGLLGPTLVAMGSVYGVHVFARYEEDAAAGAGSPADAAEAALRHLRAPVCIAGLTTMAGFAALLVSDVPAVLELGAFAALGVASITVLSLVAVPAALALLPVRAAAERRFDRALEAALDGLARRVVAHSGAIVAAAALLTGLAAAAIPDIVVDTDYLTNFDARDPVRTDFEAVNRLLAGAVPLYVVIDGGGRGGLREPERLRALEALQARLDRIDGVSRTLSFVDTIRVLNRAFEEDDPDAERVPDTRSGVSELLFMIPKTDLQRFATVNHGQANVIVRTGEVGSAAIRQLTREIRAAIAQGPWPDASRPALTGNAILLARSADGIASGQPLTIGIAALTIFGLVAFGLSSARLGLVAMVPNVVPVVVFFGLLGLGVAPLSLPTSLIGSVALGIAVDDTAHFMVRYRRERQAGAAPEAAALATVRAVGRPIAMTSLMLVAGFGVIVFSEFATLREFGALTALTMLICLLTDLVLLPATLVRFRL